MRRLAMITLAVALAGVWPLYHSIAEGSFTAIIGAGVIGPSTPLLAREVPDLVVTNNLGHDGQQFYAVARAPFDPPHSAPYLDTPAYRYRRILVPAVAWVTAPHGGTRLIASLMIIGLLGVALGAGAMSFFPGAPRWLAPVVGLTPGVIVATGLTLVDSLALGLTLCAFALVMNNRPMLAVVALTLGGLTRETVVLAAVALAFAPGLTARRRVLMVAVPSVVLLAWVVWESHALGQSITGGAADQFTFPLVGWFRSGSDGIGLVIGFLLAATLVLGIMRTRDERAVCAYLVLLLVLLATLSSDVTGSWVNTTRAVIAGLPLAAWGVVREPA